MSDLKKIIIGTIIAVLLFGGVFWIWSERSENVELLDYYEQDLDTLMKKTSFNFEPGKTLATGTVYSCKEHKMMIIEGNDNRTISVKYGEDSGKIPFSICNIRQGMSRDEVQKVVPEMEGYSFGTSSKLQAELEAAKEDLGDYFFDSEHEYTLSVQYENNRVSQVNLQRMDESWKAYLK